MSKMSIKTYSELSKLTTFEERYNYLRLSGFVGKETFGFDRYLNQVFYKSSKWRSIRDFVIVRDNGCDLGIEGREIHGRIIIHHMNPITIQDITQQTEFLLDPEFLISTAHETHNAIQKKNKNFLRREPVQKQRNNTCPLRYD